MSSKELLSIRLKVKSLTQSHKILQGSGVTVHMPLFPSREGNYGILTTEDGYTQELTKEEWSELMCIS